MLRSDLPDLLLQCCADDAPDVRHSALALLGDLVKVLNFVRVVFGQYSVRWSNDVWYVFNEWFLLYPFIK